MEGHQQAMSSNDETVEGIAMRKAEREIKKSAGAPRLLGHEDDGARFLKERNLNDFSFDDDKGEDGEASAVNEDEETHAEVGSATGGERKEVLVEEGEDMEGHQRDMDFKETKAEARAMRKAKREMRKPVEAPRMLGYEDENARLYGGDPSTRNLNTSEDDDKDAVKSAEEEDGHPITPRIKGGAKDFNNGEKGSTIVFKQCADSSQSEGEAKNEGPNNHCDINHDMSDASIKLDDLERPTIIHNNHKRASAESRNKKDSNHDASDAMTTELKQKLASWPKVPNEDDADSSLSKLESGHTVGTMDESISDQNGDDAPTTTANGSGVNDSRIFSPSVSFRNRDIPRPVSLPSRMSFQTVASARRGAITNSGIYGSITQEFGDLELFTSVKDWLRSFRDLDPRFQILEFFNDLSLEGVENFESQGCRTKGFVHTPKILRMFTKSGIFSVWRPTSSDAIAKLITGEGTGKGLNIKGKSAKCGQYSGFVPFLQIHDNDHKRKVGYMRKDKRVRVFYPNQSSRDKTAAVLAGESKYMADMATKSNQIVEEEDEKREQMLDSVTSLSSIRRPSLVRTRNIDAALIEANRCCMNDPFVYKIDDYASTQGVYGLDIPEKLFWESYVVPNDISRPRGSKHDTGRPSMPGFQQMNIETLRNWSVKPLSDANDTKGNIKEDGGMESADPEADPRPVLWHGGCGHVGEEAPEESNHMCPLGLLMAYEEHGKVTPVVSDFDCFLLGTRSVKYHEPLGTQELSMLSSCVEEIEGILATPKEGSCWTTRWLEVKMQHMRDEKSSHQMPKFGYADPLSYSMMTGAVHHLKSNGAVRHGPEAFNYGFPQELDDQYLVISDTFPGVPWRYANCEELIDIMCEKIDEGFTFPLNPKWILCDPGWKKVYDKLLASQKPNVQTSLGIWYPDEIRRRIHEISTEFPQGFVSSNGNPNYTDMSSGARFDLAQLELQRYRVRLSSSRKLRECLSRRRSVGSEKILYRSESKKFSLQSSQYESKSTFLTAVKVVHRVNKKEHSKKKRRGSSVLLEMLRLSDINHGSNHSLLDLFDGESDCDEENSKHGDISEASRPQRRIRSRVASTFKAMKSSLTHGSNHSAILFDGESDCDEENSKHGDISEASRPQRIIRSKVSSKVESLTSNLFNGSNPFRSRK